jgi:aspartyl-tRNA(Asn)/glutamyl-tRNA(Gln) amidotransferase subunit A
MGEQRMIVQGEAQTTRRDFLERSAAAIAGLIASTANPPAAVAAQPAALATQSAARAASTGGIDLPNLTVVEAAERIRRKQLSPVELTQAVLDRIAALNPKLGAFITVSGDEAMDAARAAEREIQQGRYKGPLHGIPFGVKDTHYTKGILTTAASPVLKDFIPDFDCTNVVRLKNAGAILVGKLNLPEFSFGGFTPGCNNPWDLSRNAGGSSGGSGSALGASLVLAATGGDTSGSIRNPASTNGCVGLKPTFGVVSRYGVIPISWTLDHLGPMAKTVEDTALLQKALAGYDAQDNFSARVAVPDYPRLLRRNMRGLRIGYAAESEIAQFHPDTKKAFFDAVKVLEGLGARVEPVTFPERMKTTGAAHGLIRIAEAATYHREFLRSKADLYKTTDSNVRTTVEAGSLLTASQYLRAQRARDLFLQDMAKVFEPLDVLLTPTMPAPADVEVQVPETYRTWWNLCGYPALSLPCGFSKNPAGLPIGLQVNGRPFQDALVLAVGHAYESATEWHKRHPNL